MPRPPCSDDGYCFVKDDKLRLSDIIWNQRSVPSLQKLGVNELSKPLLYQVNVFILWSRFGARKLRLGDQVGSWVGS